MNSSKNKLNSKISWFFKLEPNAHSIYDSNYEQSIFISLFNCNINLYLIPFTKLQKYPIKHMQLRENE